MKCPNMSKPTPSLSKLFQLVSAPFWRPPSEFYISCDLVHIQYPGCTPLLWYSVYIYIYIHDNCLRIMISTTKKYNNHDQNNCHHVSWHVYKIIIVSGNLTACNRTSTFWIRQSSTSGLFSRENSEQILECEWITCVKSWKVKPSRREPNLLRPWLFQLLHICAHGAIVSLKVGRPAISNRRKHCELLSVYSSTIIIYHTLLVGGAMCPSWKKLDNSSMGRMRSHIY
jgi:hypothetical protein